MRNAVQNDGRQGGRKVSSCRESFFLARSAVYRCHNCLPSVVLCEKGLERRASPVTVSFASVEALAKKTFMSAEVFKHQLTAVAAPSVG